MKKLLIVGVSSKIGGIETFFLNLFKDKSQIFEVSFLSFDKECAFSDIYLSNGYKVYVLPSRKKNPIMFAKNVKKFLKGHKEFDYIWINTSSTSIYHFQYYGKKYTSAKIITHSHGIKFEKTSGNLLYIINKVLACINYQKVIKNTDLFFACSHKAGIALYGKNKKNNIIVVRNGIETDKFKYSDEKRKLIREELGINSETLVLGMVGRLSKVKNPIKGINIFKSILNINKNAVLLLVGDGELKEDILSYINLIGLQNKIFCLGIRHDIFNIMSAIDIILMPSLFEGLPLTAIEGQTAGCVCLLSDTITEEVKITNLVEFISIDDEDSSWVEIISEKLKYIDVKSRVNYMDMVKNAKYDMRDSVKYIEDLLGGVGRNDKL